MRLLVARRLVELCNVNNILPLYFFKQLYIKMSLDAKGGRSGGWSVCFERDGDGAGVLNGC